MRRFALVTATLAACTVLGGLTVFALDPWEFSMSSVALIAIGLMMSTLVALSGFLLVRSSWGRWGLVGATALSMLLASTNSSPVVLVVQVVGAVTIVMLMGPWLRFWVRRFRAADAPNAVVTGLISIAPVAPLVVGIGAFDSTNVAQWIAAITATGMSFAYARAVPGAIWGLRLAMPVTAVAATVVSPMPWAIVIGLGTLISTTAAWLPAARQATALPPPVLPTPRPLRKDDTDASQ